MVGEAATHEYRPRLLMRQFKTLFVIFSVILTASSCKKASPVAPQTSPTTTPEDTLTTVLHDTFPLKIGMQFKYSYHDYYDLVAHPGTGYQRTMQDDSGSITVSVIDSSMTAFGYISWRFQERTQVRHHYIAAFISSPMMGGSTTDTVWYIDDSTSYELQEDTAGRHSLYTNGARCWRFPPDMVTTIYRFSEETPSIFSYSPSPTSYDMSYFDTERGFYRRNKYYYEGDSYESLAESIQITMDGTPTTAARQALENRVYGRTAR